MFDIHACVTPIDHGDDTFIVLSTDDGMMQLRHTWTRAVHVDSADKYRQCSPPENKGLKKYDQHEEVCFRNASYFSVARKVERTSKSVQYSTFPEAVDNADSRCVIYAVCASNRAVPLDRKAWNKYLQLWQSLPGVCHAPAE